MKALTYVGKTDFPIDIKMVQKGTMISGASHGDEIVSYYPYGGEYFASHKGVCSLTSGTVAKAMQDSDLPIKTGFYPDDEINYAVYQNGKYYKVEWGNYTSRGGNKYYEGSVTRDVVDIKDNLYYSLPPVWPDQIHPVFPENTYTIHPYGEKPILGTMKLFRLIQIQKYLPKFYQPYGNVFSVVEGTGKVIVTKDISQSSYVFTQADLNRKSITLRITTVPLPNSGSKDTFRDLKLSW
jgi:hypothetical protein